MKYKCKICEKEFNARPSRNRKTCSKKCRSLYLRKRLLVKCSYCRCSFERTASDMKKSKSGLQFCSRKCKENAQSISGGCKKIQPNHYKNGKTMYRKTAIKKFGAICSECGIDKKYMLIVHHKDGNRENNSIQNLEVLCQNCHTTRHLKRINGELIYDTAYLT